MLRNSKFAALFALLWCGAAFAQSVPYGPGGGGGGGSAAGITVGTSVITGGTNTRVLYDNAGVLGEYAISGTGSVAMTTSPVFVTPTLGAASATSVTASGLLQAGTTLGISTDVLLNRDAANTLAQRNGTSAQAFNLYETYTDAANRSYLAMGYDSGVFYFGPAAAGTGTARSLNILTGGAYRWQFNVAGHLLAGIDNTYDIGASGATRPRNIYAGTNILAPQIYTPTQTLTDAATINWDMNAGSSAVVTLGGSRTMAAPTNLKNGGSYSLKIIQDGTGSRTITWNAVFKWPGGVAPTLSTAVGAIDYVTCISDGTNLYCAAQTSFS